PEHTQPGRLLPKIGKAAALLGIGVGGALLSAEYIGTETTIAEHRAVTTLTHDSLATVDLGILGAVAFPLDDTHGLGAHITIKETPADISLGSNPADFSASELQSYAQLLGDVESDIKETTENTAKQAARNGIILMAGAAAMYTFLGADI